MTFCNICSYYFHRKNVFCSVLRFYATSLRSTDFGKDRVKMSNASAEKKLQSEEKERRKFLNYDEMIRHYLFSARNSVLIRTVTPLKSMNLISLLSDSLQSTPLTRTNLYVHYYSLGHGNNYYLCDIGRNNVERLIKSLPHIQTSGIPVRFRMLSYSNQSMPRIGLGDPSESVNSSLVRELIQKASSLNHQMSRLVDITEITPKSVALRFFCASIIEDIFSGLLPFSSCLPFGSTMNGFGQKGCDLDMALEMEDKNVQRRMDETKSNLKVILRPYNLGDNNDRTVTQKVLDVYGESIMKLMPFCSNVQNISRARVPIIKFNWKLGSFACDLTINNTTGQEMAKILWIYSQIDDRLRPLMFAVRFWANQIELTGESRGQRFDGMTNFQLICLVIFFLQIHAKIRLPPITVLRRNAVGSDDFGIVSQPSCIPYFYDSTLSAADLFVEFFHFYANFNFERDGISLVSGEIVNNIDGYGLYIRNPVEIMLNVSKNVSRLELKNFVDSVRRTVDILKDTNNMKSNSNSPWGLLKMSDFKIESNNSSPSDRSDEIEAEQFIKQTKKLTIDDLLSEKFNEDDSYV